MTEITSRHPRVVGCNVQSAVDTKHHLIVAHEVTIIGTARNALHYQTWPIRRVTRAALRSSMSLPTRAITSARRSLPAKMMTSNAKARGRFDRSAFIYDAEQDLYVCPAGQNLTPRMTRHEDGKVLHRYWTTACATCPVKHHYTPS